jgi:hypothetical protein
MKLIESDAEGPSRPVVDVTPPRPEKRRVSISLLFTLAVLVSTVAGVYLLLPARDNILITEAIQSHRRDVTTFSLAAPSAGELKAWGLGTLAQKDAPLAPQLGATIVAADTLVIHRRNAATIRYKVGQTELTLLIQHAKGWAPDKAFRREGNLFADMGHVGEWTVVTVGEQAMVEQWVAARDAK